ncbi:MAG TPA: hypothetical protein VF607_17510, partial [Verrucomicrobiae bacterium]
MKRAALWGSALAVGPSAYAGLFGKSRDTNTFFLLSDTHIAADPATVNLKTNMAANLQACAHELSAWPVKPAAIVVN